MVSGALASSVLEPPDSKFPPESKALVGTSSAHVGELGVRDMLCLRHEVRGGPSTVKEGVGCGADKLECEMQVLSLSGCAHSTSVHCPVKEAQ